MSEEKFEPLVKDAVVADVQVFKCLCESHHCDCGHSYKVHHGFTHCPKCGNPARDALNKR